MDYCAVARVFVSAHVVLLWFVFMSKLYIYSIDSPILTIDRNNPLS